MTFLGEIIEFYLQYDNFLENCKLENLETKNKTSKLNIDVSCYFLSSARGAFKTGPC